MSATSTCRPGNGRTGWTNAEVTPLYADCSLLVFDKPSGLLAVPGRGADKQDCLAARAQARYPDALIVHRLDMATSGLMVMARGPAMQRALNMAFAGRAVKKRYIAVVAGRLEAPPQDWGAIDLPIIVELVDTREKLERFLAFIDNEIAEGLATLEKAQIHFYRSGQSS